MAERSSLLLKRQLKELAQSGSFPGFSAGLADDGDLYKWEVCIVGPESTCYDGGLFKATLNFPLDYPDKPPTMNFTSKMWHPNVHLDGSVCISILHEPGDDKYGYEKASERWKPVHGVESILLSVISMLADPNPESPANIDAAKQFRDNYSAFKSEVAKCVRSSLESFE